MWPASFWEKLYEPAIRRAAGLGRASTAPDPDHDEACHAHCDVLVGGAGAAGLAAARAAGEAGARVILAEQDFLAGGGLLAEPAQEAWRRETLAALDALPNVTPMLRTTVFGYYEQNMLGALERVADHLPEPPPHQPRQRYWTIRAREVVLATGADERLIAFPGNDRPGVMLAGAARTYARRVGVLAGRRAVLFANNDEAYGTVAALAEAGADRVAVVDPRPLGPAAAAARRQGFEVLTGHEVTGGHGGRGIYSVEARAVGSAGGFQIDADLLCISGGYGPAIQLASQSRTAMRWDDRIAAFVPGEAAGQRSAGAARGCFGIAAAARDGLAAGRAAATAAGFPPGAAFVLPDADDPDPTVTPFWEVPAR
ncbi:MAG: FAD-dependent oxidoreductase, partial [Gemmatimonadaceae bacterium]|nr:FAD-dependent oxidoreductase [Gemmatimonadaceae bacterium]